MDHTVVLYRDKAGEWRWHRVSSDNGHILSDSGEGYENFDDCIEMAELVNSEADFVLIEPS